MATNETKASEILEQAKADGHVKVVSGETTVKVAKAGSEPVEHKVPYSYLESANLEGALAVVAKDVDTENKDVAYRTADGIVIARFNQVTETNARQAARAAFLAGLEGPDKQIASVAKKMAALLGITEAQAEVMVRAQMKDAGKL